MRDGVGIGADLKCCTSCSKSSARHSANQEQSRHFGETDMNLHRLHPEQWRRHSDTAAGQEDDALEI